MHWFLVSPRGSGRPEGCPLPHLTDHKGSKHPILTLQSKVLLQTKGVKALMAGLLKKVLFAASLNTDPPSLIQAKKKKNVVIPTLNSVESRACLHQV